MNLQWEKQQTRNEIVFKLELDICTLYCIGYPSGGKYYWQGSILNPFTQRIIRESHIRQSSDKAKQDAINLATQLLLGANHEFQMKLQSVQSSLQQIGINYD